MKLLQSGSLLLLAGTLLLQTLGGAQAQETSAASLLRVTPRGTLRYNSDGPGFDPYVHFEGFLPLAQQPDQNLTFLDGRLLLSTDNGTFSGNVVLAHRFFSGSNQIFGGYVAYDRRNTGNSNFDQISFGLERLTSNLDLRLNTYFPVGETRSVVDSRLGNTARIVGNTIGIDRQQNFEVALRGLDAEAGTRLFALGQGHVWGYVGAYYYAGADFAGFAGARGRLVARPQKNVEVNLTVQSDSEFGTRAWVGVGLTFPGLPETRRQDNSVNLAARLSHPVERQIAVVVAEQTVRDTVAAINPLTGQPYRVVFVNTGAGSFTDLSTLSFATNDVVLVGTVNNLFASSGNVNLVNNVLLLSANINQSVNTTFGLVTLQALTPSPIAPTIRGTVNLASNNTVSGFNITPTNAAGIQGSNISNPTLRNNTINGASTGILLQNVGNPVIANNLVTSSVTRGVSVSESVNARVTSNTVVGAVGEGIGLDNALGTVLIDGNTVRNVTQTAIDTNLEAGIFIRNNRGDANITISNNLTEDNLQSGNRVDGIEVNLCRGNSFAPPDRFTDNAFATCSAPASMTVNVTNNIVRRMGTGTDGSDGIDFNLGDGAIMTANLDRNLVEDIADAGITFDIVSSDTPIARPTLTLNITNNIIRRMINDDAITVESNSGGAVILNITGNTIQDVRSVGAGGNDGIDLEFTTTATNPARNVVNISNNQITQISDRAIEIDANNNATLQLTISNNTLGTTATSIGESIRVRTENNGALTATINNNTMTQGNPTVRSLEARADDTSRLCGNIFQNVQTAGTGFTLRPDDAGVNFRIVNSTNLGALNNGVPVVTTGAGTVTNISEATFNAPTPGGCTLP